MHPDFYGWGFQSLEALLPLNFKTDTGAAALYSWSKKGVLGKSLLSARRFLETEPVGIGPGGIGHSRSLMFVG